MFREQVMPMRLRSGFLPGTRDGCLSRAQRTEVRNERIFRFVCLESVACDSYAGARPRPGRSAVALAEVLSVGPVPARATLHARPRPEMARKARALHWALELVPMKIRHIGSAAPNAHQAATGHIADKSFIERATAVLLLGLLWSGLAACILGALSYDIAYWFEGS